jgi:hypothetical protein
VNEWDRLYVSFVTANHGDLTFYRDKQHRAITLGLDGLYPAQEVVRAVLAPQDGVAKKILDLGEHDWTCQYVLTTSRVWHGNMVNAE